MKLPQRKPDAKGAECRVWFLDDAVLKVYPDQENAQYAYLGQRWAYRCGIATPVLSRIHTLNSRAYGFFVGRAEPYPVIEPHRRMKSADIDYLTERLAPLGYGHDIKRKNAGLWKGRVVAIDFGYRSRTNKGKRKRGYR